MLPKPQILTTSCVTGTPLSTWYRLSSVALSPSLNGAKHLTMSHYRSLAWWQVLWPAFKEPNTIGKLDGKILTALSLVWTASHFPTTGRHEHRLLLNAPDHAKMLKPTGFYGWSIFYWSWLFARAQLSHWKCQWLTSSALHPPTIIRKALGYAFTFPKDKDYEQTVPVHCRVSVGGCTQGSTAQH